MAATMTSACASQEATPPPATAATSASRPEQQPTAPAAPAAPSPTGETAAPAAAADLDRRAEELLAALFVPPSSGGDFFDAVNANAVRLAGDLGHPGMVPPLVEISRFAFTREATAAVADSLRKLTGSDLGSDFEPWYAWLGQRPDHPVVNGYDRWKGLMLAQVDSRFTQFFYRDVPARVSLSGAVWGGVRVDGIPPLNDPLFVSADEASYLLDDDVVIGVEINGDARAYPHRILAWHEISNDVVGGRPVVLVY